MNFKLYYILVVSNSWVHQGTIYNTNDIYLYLDKTLPTYPFLAYLSYNNQIHKVEA